MTGFLTFANNVMGLSLALFNPNLLGNKKGVHCKTSRLEFRGAVRHVGAERGRNRERAG